MSTSRLRLFTVLESSLVNHQPETLRGPGFDSREEGQSGIAGLLGLALSITLALLCVGVAPSTALAAFTDVTDSNPAAQDLGSYDNPITGDMLPDGAYKVRARTTSSMCILYTNPDDADARDSKEQAIVLAEGGSLTAVFYISKAYNYLYLGTQEEAAAQTNEDGTDASAYIAGDPPDGYVPHLFTLPIPALNTPITFAAYTGGSHGDEEGIWYTRTAVFAMTEAELQAAIDAAEGTDSEPEQDQDQEEPEVIAEQDSSETIDDGGGTQGELSEDNVVAETAEDESTGNGSGENEDGETEGEPSEIDSENSADSESAQKSEESPAPSADLKHGVRIYGIEDKLVVDTSKVEKIEFEEPEKPLFTRERLLALAIVGIALAGVALRGALFKLGFEQPGVPDSNQIVRHKQTEGQ